VEKPTIKGLNEKIAEAKKSLKEETDIIHQIE
jgi:hypothetical protein